MPAPTLSVLLPNYNHAEYLPKCLDEILSQSFTDFELIIIDDASTDDSVDVINEHLELPLLDVGDLILGHAMGAYTWASASEFNFFPRATVLALDRGRLFIDRGRR